MSINLSPKTINNNFTNNFTTNIITNNILLTKHIINIQKIIIPQITNHIKKITINNNNLITKLKKIIKNNFKNLTNNLTKNNPLTKIIKNKNLIIHLIISKFLSNFKTSLPQPNSTTITNQNTTLNNYITTITKTIKNYINNNLFTTKFNNKTTNKTKKIKNILHNHFIHK